MSIAMKGSIQKGRFPFALTLCLLVVSCSAQKKFLRPSLPDDARSEALTTLPSSPVTSDPEVEGLIAGTALPPPVGASGTSAAQQTGLSPPISSVPGSVSTTETATLSTTATGSVSGGSGNTTDVTSLDASAPMTLTTPTTSTMAVPTSTTLTSPSTSTLAVPMPTTLTTPGAVPETSLSPSVDALSTTESSPASGAVTTTLGVVQTTSPAPSFSLMPSTTIGAPPASNSTTTLPANDTSTLPTNNTGTPNVTTGSVPPERQQPFLHRKVGIEDVSNSSLVSLVAAEGDIPSYIGNNVLKSWFEFEWNVPVAGFYDVYAGVASPEGAGSFSLIDMNTTLPYETFTGFNVTMAWDEFASFSRQIEVLEPGLKTLRVETVTEGYNLQYLYLTPDVLRDAIEERDGGMV